MIVVGGIKEGSIQYVPHPHGPNEGMSWEHHATLRVVRVLKGRCELQEIPIVIRYGLEPLVDGHSKHDGHEVHLPPAAGTGKGAVQIVDVADDVLSDPAIPDARADNLWFLRAPSATAAGASPVTVSWASSIQRTCNRWP